MTATDLITKIESLTPKLSSVVENTETDNVAITLKNMDLETMKVVAEKYATTLFEPKSYSPHFWFSLQPSSGVHIIVQSPDYELKQSFEPKI